MPCVCSRRQSLPLISVKQLQKMLGPSGRPDILCAVCILASWNPVCRKLENYELQAAHWQLQQEAAAAGQGGSGSSSSATGAGGNALEGSIGIDATRIQVGNLQCLPDGRCCCCCCLQPQTHLCWCVVVTLADVHSNSCGC